MSPRARLIITALFLLLAVPSLYIALVWSPPGTLHFSVGAADPPASNDPKEWRKVKVMITNTGSTPMHLERAWVEDLKPGRAGKSFIGFDISQEPWDWASYTHVIPPDGSLGIVSLIQTSSLEALEDDRFIVHYKWKSKLKSQSASTLKNLYTHLPRDWDLILPRIFSESDDALLEVPTN